MKFKLVGIVGLSLLLCACSPKTTVSRMIVDQYENSDGYFLVLEDGYEVGVTVNEYIGYEPGDTYIIE